MWAILLKVLSIIGIVLGCILGVILVLLLLCLLCPIVYKISGSAHEEVYKAKIRIHYLFGIVRAGYTYPEPGNIYVKAAWFTIYDSSKGEEAEEDEVTDNNKENAELEIIDLNETDLEDESKDTEFCTNINETDVKNSESEEGSAEESGDDAASDKDSKKKIYNPLYYIKKAFEEFRYKVITKIKLIYKDISFYYKLLTHDDTTSLLSKAKKHLIRILKQLIPKTGHANVTFGTGSPDTTAYVFGIYSVVMFRKARKYVLIPDFENKIIDGDMAVKGWFNLFGMLIEALPVVLSKKLRLTKARFDKHGDNMDIARRKAQKKHERILKELEEEYSA